MADPEAPDAEPEDPARRERHATNLELFLDLVFVFAVTQLAVLIEGHLTVPGVLRGVLLAFLVWWQWSQFTWAGAAMDLQAHTVSRLLVLCMVPVTLLMTVAIPDAFGRSGPWFGWAYFGVQVLVISMMGALTVHGSAQRQAFVRYASLALVSPTVVLLGAYLHGDARVIAWCVAAVLDVVAALVGGGGSGRSTPPTSPSGTRCSSSSPSARWWSRRARPRSPRPTPTGCAARS
jgi:low temperature requirement protein LtrA